MKTELSVLSNEALIAETKRSVGRERRATIAVLERLGEIYRRCLHLELGYGSLHGFTVAELGYSDGSADRRIQAMKLCEDLPKAKDSIVEGRLSLCAAATMQHHLRREPDQFSTVAEREALLLKLEGKSRRECERILDPEQTGTPVRFLADDQTLEDIERISQCLGIPRSNMRALMGRICQIARSKVDPMLKKARQPRITPPAEPARIGVEAATPPVESRETGAQALTPPAEPEVTHANVPTPPRRRPYTRAWIKSLVLRRVDGRCSFVSPLTARRCESRYKLQRDHIIPFSFGGQTTPENLRLLCAAHHWLVTVQTFGKEKVESYVHRR